MLSVFAESQAETMQLGCWTVVYRSIGAGVALTAQTVVSAIPLISKLNGIAFEPQTTFACKISSLRCLRG